MYVQGRSALTQSIFILQSTLKTNMNPQMYQIVTNCVEKLTKIQTKINNVQQGTSGFIDHNVNQLQNVSAFLMNCSTDIVSYYFKYIETASETNRSKNTSSKKGFWMKAIQVIMKANKQAESQNNKERQWKILTQQNEQLKRKLQQIEQKQKLSNSKQKQSTKQPKMDDKMLLKYLETLRVENTKQQQIITENQKQLNVQKDCQKKFLSIIKQLENKIIAKNKQINDTQNLIAQNLKVKDEQIVILRSQLKKQINVSSQTQLQNVKIKCQKQHLQKQLGNRDQLNKKIKISEQHLKNLQTEICKKTFIINDLQLLKQTRGDYDAQYKKLLQMKEQFNMKTIEQEKYIKTLQKQLKHYMQNQQAESYKSESNFIIKQTMRKNQLLEQQCQSLRVIVLDISKISKRFQKKCIAQQSNQYFGGIISTAQKQVLFEEFVQLYEPIKIKLIKLVFKYPLMSLDSCTQILKGKSHLVFIVRLTSGMIVTMYSEQVVSDKKRMATGKGFIASLTNCTFFKKRKDIQNAPTASIKNGILSFGASEIMLNLEEPNNLEINIGFGNSNHSFETGENTAHVLTDGKSCEIDSYEIYEIILESSINQ